MPVYTYECGECGKIFDRSMSLKHLTHHVSCESCAGDARKIIVPGYGIQDDHPVWLDDSIRQQLQDTDDPTIKPIETRAEYNRYLRDNGIIPTG